MIDYTEKIPNNVDLGRDRVLQRALEHWQPAFLGWWSTWDRTNRATMRFIFERRPAWSPMGGRNLVMFACRKSLGNFSATSRRDAASQFWPAQGAGGLARGSRRISLDFAARHCDARGHRARFR